MPPSPTRCPPSHSSSARWWAPATLTLTNPNPISLTLTLTLNPNQVGTCGQRVLTLCGRRADGQTIHLNLQHEGVKLILPALLSARSGGASPVQALGSRWRWLVNRWLAWGRGAREAKRPEQPVPTDPCGSQSARPFQPLTVELMLSPECLITESRESRPYRGDIPPEAKSFCFV